MHKMLNMFEFLPDPTTDALERQIFKILSCGHSSAFIFDRIFFIFAGNEDNHKVADEFEIPPDPPVDCRVTCSCP